MKIWIDISNAPHVNFFKEFINEWVQEHEVIVTTRPLSNTIDLLEKNNIVYDIVGSHYGKNAISKFSGFFKRSNELYSFLKTKQIDLAISQSSFYSPYVAKRLKIPSIYTNDNEFAKGNYVGFLLANHILLPEALKKWADRRFFRKRVSFYPGVKEGIYIKKRVKILSKKDNSTIYFRPEPWHAQYHNFNIDTFDKVLIELAKKNHIIILPRDKNQMDHYINLSKENDHISVSKKVETVESISEKCDIFLGAGGSMTREFAILGIPTISLYQGELLAVDKYLIDHGVLISEIDSSIINQGFLDALLEEQNTRYDTCVEVLNKGIQARKLINELVNNTLIKGVS